MLTSRSLKLGGLIHRPPAARDLLEDIVASPLFLERTLDRIDLPLDSTDAV
jgi:hypothetical protein